MSQLRYKINRMKSLWEVNLKSKFEKSLNVIYKYPLKDGLPMI